MARKLNLTKTALRTTVIVAAGPSLDGAADELAAIANCGHNILAVGDAFRRLPNANQVYHCDPRWWRANIEAVRERHPMAQLLTIDPSAADVFGLTHVACIDFHESKPGFCRIPETITQGSSSGYQALHYAVTAGAQRVVLFGYDYGASGLARLNGDPCTSDFPLMLRALAVLAADLGAMGVQVLNASSISAVACFPRVQLLDVL